MLRVGQIVTCIDDVRGTIGAQILPNFVVRGRSYTVRAIRKDPAIPGYGVLLEELANPSVHSGADAIGEWAFDARRFRLDRARKTDISVFENLLRCSGAELALAT